jgi:hypothetical protein
MVNEIGRELKANELKLKMIVIVVGEHKPNVLVSMWVAAVGPDSVTFFAGEIKTYFIASIREDGSLADDVGRVIHCFEYLGEP